MRLSLVLALLATPALAQETFRSGEGHDYALAPLEGGGVTLTSESGPVRDVGGATLDGPDVLTLRPDCTAEADGEAGTWREVSGLIRGGVEVELPGRTVVFRRQDLSVEGANCAAG